MAVYFKNGRLVTWNGERKTFDSDEQLLFSIERYAGSLVLTSVTNPSLDSSRTLRSYQLSAGNVAPGATLPSGMVRCSAGQWQRDWFTFAGTFVVYHKWMPVPADGYRLGPVIRQSVDIRIEDGKLMLFEDLSIRGRAGQGGFFGGGLISPAVTLDYALTVGGFN
ncbi:hypothetical protein [Stappia sp. ICDLI1TA098]